MGVLTTTREMPAPTKIRRGIGLLLLGLLVMAIGGALLAVDLTALPDVIGWPVVVLLLLLEWAALIGAVAGLVLLLWGLLGK